MLQPPTGPEATATARTGPRRTPTPPNAATPPPVSLCLSFSLYLSLPCLSRLVGFFFSINSLFGPDSSVKEYFHKFLYNLKETKMQIAHQMYDEMPQPLFSSFAFFLLEKKCWM
jgi:hypothetical protein